MVQDESGECFSRLDYTVASFMAARGVAIRCPCRRLFFSRITRSCHGGNLRFRRLVQELPREGDILLSRPRCIDSIMPYLAEMLVVDMDDQSGDELLHPHPQGFPFLSFSPVLVLECYVVSV